MTRLRILGIVFVFACSSALAQTSRPSRLSLLIDKSKPVVYVTFLKETQESHNEGKYLLFKLINNSPWNIIMDMSGPGDKALGDADLYYTIEDSKAGTIRSGSTICHVCSFNRIHPGKSITFAVSSERIAHDALMRLQYSFAWENDFQIAESNSSHYVEYYFSSLPESVSLSLTRKP
jgi:hypothetical protein